MAASVSASLVHRVLAHYLNRAPADIEIVKAPGGKPVLAPRAGDPAIGFSLSHTRGLVAIAVAIGATGVDAEAPRAIGRPGQIARRWFTGDEAAEVEAAAPLARYQVFLEHWCAKEALAKRHGAGLRLMRREGLAVAPEIAAGRLVVLAMPSGHLAAIACDRAMHELYVT